MEALDCELAATVAGGMTLDSFLATLAREGEITRNGSAMGRVGDTFY